MPQELCPSSSLANEPLIHHKLVAHLQKYSPKEIEPEFDQASSSTYHFTENPGDRGIW